MRLCLRNCLILGRTNVFMFNHTTLFIIIITTWNIFSFALYGTDKHKARKMKWRISEKTLILCAFLMGSVGALLGMKIFRHKTKHLKFKLLLPLALIVNIVITALILHCFGIINFYGMVA